MKRIYEDYAEFINGFPLWALLLTAALVLFTFIEVSNYVGEAIQVADAYDSMGMTLEMVTDVLGGLGDLFN